ncbi:unnamed protein product [Lactuca virosa]|uniref:Uncharacterized protein n=1 Tax=Lactuca virosa TaxID=75947 RepID=A0AAU9M0A9_9ASTR|nr:unnamed protein product [Lactuca virosa]
MEKNNEKIHLEKRYLEEKVKNLREKKTGQKGNEAFGSRKGKVEIVSDKIDKLNPPLTKEQQVDQAKRDALLDELNALNAKFNAEEAKKKNVEAILANKKALFPSWSLEGIEEEGYIIEIAKMDVEISSVLNRRPIVKPMDPPENLDSVKVRFIENEN